MKIAVLGGYGVFGSRLAELLKRDGHDVIVVGRNPVAGQRLATKIGAEFLKLDIQADLSPLWACQLDAVVDAAGPFHGYGDDPYRIAKGAIAHRVNYLDLADDTAFCAGIASLDESAKAAGVFALSGISSVPALSSAAVASLADGVDEIEHIETAILPGNRAPRGQAVVDSILYQAGTPIDVTIDGAVEPVRSWSRSKVFQLTDADQRRGFMIRVPDQSLFPAAFNAKTVTFYAGLEVGLMNHGLSVFSWVRGKVGFSIPNWFAKSVRWAADLLHGLGTDTGGMVVKVICRNNDQWEERVWRLYVRNGEGPYVPAIAARTILRQPETIEAGARPGLNAFPLVDAVDAMDDLAASTDTTASVAQQVFKDVLSDDFAKLPVAVRQSHETVSPRRLSGMATISRGEGLWSKVIAAVIGFPKAATDVPVTVMKTPHGKGEIWVRRFGDQTFRSFLKPGPDGMREHFGPFSFDLDLHADETALMFPVKRGRLLGVPLPRFLLPNSEASETEQDGRFWFDVALKAPITGQLIVHYRGYLSRNSTPNVSEPKELDLIWNNSDS